MCEADQMINGKLVCGYDQLAKIREAGKCFMCAELDERIAELENQIASLRSTRTELLDYLRHQSDCVLSYFECGEPTKDGGYRQKFKGKWYQAKPVDETPPCNCGLMELLAKLDSK